MDDIYKTNADECLNDLFKKHDNEERQNADSFKHHDGSNASQKHGEKVSEASSCGCDEGCTCGEGCDNTPQNKCTDDCTCGENMTSSCGCGSDCECGDDLNCEENCDCGTGNNSSCGCGENCTCGDDCNCTPEDKCNDNCTCGTKCGCGDDCNCPDDCGCRTGGECTYESCGCNNHNEKHHEKCQCGCGEEIETESVKQPSDDAFNSLLRLQAEFDNYRKRTEKEKASIYHNGFVDAVTDFLPALDSFKMAKEYITDKNTLIGIEYIEKGILKTLEKMGVTTIDATGKFDPNFHQAIDTSSDEGYEAGDIVKECYKGFKMGDKVIRFSQVIVKR